MTDPKAQAGARKTPLHLLPTISMRLTAEVLGLGRAKYGEYNWRKSGGVETNTYIGAIRRHLDAFSDGEDADPESGITHLAHIAATCAILMDAESQGKLLDNRYKSLSEGSRTDGPATK